MTKPVKVTATTLADENHAVLTVEGGGKGYQKKPCPECPCMSAAEHKRLLAEIESLKAAMRADIQGAGPTTGPIYHQNIREALGLPAEGSGADLVMNVPFGWRCKICGTENKVCPHLTGGTGGNGSSEKM
jgi:hypothetical protein